MAHRMLSRCRHAIGPCLGGHIVGHTWAVGPAIRMMPNRSLSTIRAMASSPIMAPSAPKTPVAMEPEKLPSVKTLFMGPQTWAGDLLVLTAYEEDVKMEGDASVLQEGVLKALNVDLAGAVAEIVAAGGFEGKQGTSSKAVRVGGGALAKYVALVGLGKRDKVAAIVDWGAGPFQALGGAVAGLAKINKSRSVAVALQETPQEAARTIQQIVSGALLSGYESTRFKSKPSPTASKMEDLAVLLPPLEGQPTLAAEVVDQALAQALARTRGTYLTKYLVEAPPNVCTPSFLAAAAQHIVDQSPGVMKLEVLEADQCRDLGMGLYLGVAEASDEPAKFIHLTYTPPDSSPGTRKVAIVGKGVTFDSGGYNLKAGPGSMIELMKFDMGGAAATLGAARILGQVQPHGVEVHFCIAACENMVGGHGLRPGDILTGSSGKTVEVNNTDAEGRLTLADALWFAQEKCQAVSVVDVATLTGAMMIALGTEIAGMFTPSDTMATALSSSSKLAGEKIWRMPLESNYWDSMKSPVADMRNSGDRYGSSISAALFLQQFIKDGVDWAHIDLAGPVWDMKAGLPTGYGATTLAEWAMAQGTSKQ